MPPIDADDLLRFASRIEGQRLKTRVRGAGFSVRILAEGLEITPESSGEPRLVRREGIEIVLDEYHRSSSLQPADYHEITWDSSYLLTLVEPTSRAPMGRGDQTSYDNATPYAAQRSENSRAVIPSS
jgi:hypothetical protein